MKSIRLIGSLITASACVSAAMPAQANPWLPENLGDYCNTYEAHNVQSESASHSEGSVFDGHFTPTETTVSDVFASNTTWSQSSADLIASRDCGAVVNAAAQVHIAETNAATQVHIVETQVRSNHLMNLLAW
ncbi:MAG: hypothetical protein AB4040_03600 [Synechococcus sp.]